MDRPSTGTHCRLSTARPTASPRPPLLAAALLLAAILAGGVADAQTAPTPATGPASAAPVEAAPAAEAAPARSEPAVTPAEAQVLAQAAEQAKTDPAAAGALVRAALTADASAALPFACAAYALQAGREAEAVPDLEEALRRMPSFQRARIILAKTLLRLQRPADAVTQLRALLPESAPGTLEALRLVAFALSSGGYPAAAEAAYRQALVWDPDDPELNGGLLQALIDQGRSAEVVTLARTQVRRQPGDTRWWRLLANACLDRESPGEALVTLECARLAGVADKDMLAVLGDLNLDRGFYADAASAYLAAAAADLPPERLLRVADALLAAGRNDEALRLLERLRAQAAALPAPAQAGLARLGARHALQTGNRELAVTQLRQALALDPLDGESLLLLADLTARESPETARDLLGRATAVPAARLRALTSLAHLEVSERHYAEALSCLQQAIALNPDPRLERYRDQVLEASRAAGP